MASYPSKVHLCLQWLFIYTRRTLLTGLMYLSIPATPSSGILGRCVSLPLTEWGLNLDYMESSSPWNVGQRMWEGRKAAFCRFVNPAMEQLFSAVGEMMPLRFSPMGLGSQVQLSCLSITLFLSFTVWLTSGVSPSMLSSGWSGWWILTGLSKSKNSSTVV